MFAVARILVVVSLCGLHAAAVSAEASAKAGGSAQSTPRAVTDFIGPGLESPVFGWYDSSLAPSDRVYVVFDLFGRFNAIHSLNAATSFAGRITETPLADGRARVHVVLRGFNVVTWARRDSIASDGAVVFGHHPSTAEAKTDAALADVRVHVEFIIPAPGAPLPPFAALFDPAQGYQVEKLLVEGSAAGTLRGAFGVAEGTGGRVHVTQRALYGVPGLAEEGRFAAEQVSVKALGRR